MKKVLFILMAIFAIASLNSCNKNKKDAKPQDTSVWQFLNGGATEVKSIYYMEYPDNNNVLQISNKLEGKINLYIKSIAINKDTANINLYHNDFTNNEISEYYFTFKATAKQTSEDEITISSIGKVDNTDYIDGKFIKEDAGIFKSIEIKFNTKTKSVIELKDNGPGVSSVYKFDCKLDPNKMIDFSQKKPFYINKNVSRATLSRSFSVRKLEGIMPIHVQLNPNTWLAKRAAYIIQPEGDWQAKFVKNSDGSIQFYFCDKNGNTYKPTDESYDNLTGFRAGNMPFALYFLNVRLHQEGNNISDALYGHNHIKANKRSESDAPKIPTLLTWLLSKKLESNNAKVLNTNLMTQGIKVDLDLPLSFTAIITLK